MGRVCGDSDCSGPTTPPLSSSDRFRLPSHTDNVVSSTKPRKSSELTRLHCCQKNISALTRGFMAHPLVCLGFHLCFHRCSERKGGRAHSIYCTIIGWETRAAICQPGAWRHAIPALIMHCSHAQHWMNQSFIMLNSFFSGPKRNSCRCDTVWSEGIWTRTGFSLLWFSHWVQDLFYKTELTGKNHTVRQREKRNKSSLYNILGPLSNCG